MNPGEEMLRKMRAAEFLINGGWPAVAIAALTGSLVWFARGALLGLGAGIVWRLFS